MNTHSEKSINQGVYLSFLVVVDHLIPLASDLHDTTATPKKKGVDFEVHQ